MDNSTRLGNQNAAKRPAEAWADVVAKVSRFGWQEARTLVIDEAVRKAVRSVGGFRSIGRCTDYQLRDKRQEFIENYQAEG